MIIFQTTTYFHPHLNDLCFFEEKSGTTKKLVSALEPSSNQSGPKDLFCLSWAICFYKTSKKVLEEQGQQDKDLKVKITLEILKDKQGFCFKPTAILGIDKMSLEQTQIILEQTHQRCPISRLISLNPHVKIKVAPYHELITQ
ncbi:OsmC family protein ['Fragaria x ananassa' phyllody phytoplasma]|uniref:OsmC family protein n=1 Tax='Fragaria x ananassa' phyllody phytoplasma TaxID=2358428 RepID=A0ABS5K321_9MOLU|nr:OsmC family protein ['Fragaria x ananassa' phyllody phytoplasma]MBS2126295.1 OsmC family protein ['Fragaria x ananassa' phyllody phytoplasma]